MPTVKTSKPRNLKSYYNSCSATTRLILEWKWSQEDSNPFGLSEFRRSLWRTIELASEEALTDLARCFSAEVHAVRMARNTWVLKQLEADGVLPPN